MKTFKKRDTSAKLVKSFRGVHNNNDDDGSFEIGISTDTNREQVMFVSKTKFPIDVKEK